MKSGEVEAENLEWRDFGTASGWGRESHEWSMGAIGVYVWDL